VKEGILELEIIVTDRELALISIIDTLFLLIYYILYYWHININIVAKTKGFFPLPVKHRAITIQYPSFQSFLYN
jgi:hypothetical protein